MKSVGDKGLGWRAVVLETAIPTWGFGREKLGPVLERPFETETPVEEEIQLMQMNCETWVEMGGMESAVENLSEWTAAHCSGTLAPAAEVSAGKEAPGLEQLEGNPAARSCLAQCPERGHTAFGSVTETAVAAGSLKPAVVAAAVDFGVAAGAVFAAV